MMQPTFKNGRSKNTLVPIFDARWQPQYNAVIGALALLVAGCATEANDGAPQSGSESSAEETPDASTPLYVIATAVTDADGANTYVKLVESLDVQQPLDLGGAREFPGWSDLKVIGDKIFVSSGEAPIVYRFAVDAHGGLVADGEISFARYGTWADMYYQFVVSPTKAYLFAESGEYVLWNPATLEITGTIPFPEFEARGAIEAGAALDRGAYVRGNRLFHAVNWYDYTNYTMTSDSRIVVLDTQQDVLVTVLEAPCPNLDVATEDEQGNIYFSNWVYSPAATILDNSARACVVRIPAGSDTLDSSWAMTFAEVTGGHEAAALGYIADGTALLSVFFEDHQTFDPAEDDVFGWIFGANWRFQMLDMETQQTTDVVGIDWHSGGYYDSKIDGRTYLLVPGENYDSTTLYVLGPDGSAQRTISMNGWSTRVFRVR